MGEVALTYLSWMLAIGCIRRQLDGMPATGTEATRRGQARLQATALALPDIACSLTAIVTVATHEVLTEAEHIGLMESRYAELVEARRARAASATEPGEDAVREVLRLLPFTWREAVMDWVRRPYVGASPRDHRMSEDPVMVDLVARFGRLEAAATGALDRVMALDHALRRPPSPARRAALAEVPARVEELRQLAASASEELRARYRHLCRVAEYRKNLEYVVARVDPRNHSPRRRPRPLPGVEPDPLRTLTRRVLPLDLRRSVMDWVLP